MKPGLNLNVGQSTTLSVQMQQAVRLLQLSSLELNLEIRDLLEANPMLDVDDEEVEVSEHLAVSKEYFIEENFLPDKQDLHDYLHWQINLINFNVQDKLIAEVLIDAIDEDGYLNSSLVEIRDIFQPVNVSLEEIEIVLHQIQQLEPVGVGARNLQECMQLQLQAMPEKTDLLQEAKIIVNNHLDLLAKKKVERIEEILDLDNDKTQKILNIISGLDPKPGKIKDNAVPEYIIPDAMVDNEEGVWKVSLNNDLVPKLRINPWYACLANDKTGEGASHTFKQQLAEAKWFIKSLQQRNDTILKVVKYLIGMQQDFLDKGEKFMQPLTIAEVADHLGIHSSTVSRAISKKYLETPHGLLEMKHFFSSHVTTNKGKEFSSIAIRAMIRDVVDKEVVGSPLSDSKIAKILNSKGIEIARRTITKYRESMSIPTVAERRLRS